MRGGANVNKQADREVECFSRVKTAQNGKTGSGIERKKHENVKQKEDDVSGAILAKTTCMSRQGGCSTCPPNNPINERTLSLGPRLSPFSEVRYGEQLRLINY